LNKLGIIKLPTNFKLKEKNNTNGGEEEGDEEEDDQGASKGQGQGA
jgi:hypothetical protein